jgi:hypothetical protein
MAVSARFASWEVPDDRIASAVWLGIIWLGIVIGFGVDIPAFLRETPAAAGIVYLHAGVFLGWLTLVTAQIVFVLRGRMDQHRRVGSKAGYIAVLMVLLGLATGLTSVAQGLRSTTPVLTGHEPPALLALNLVDLLGFITFIALGLKYRNHPAAHKRLIMLGMVSLAADPGFARSMEYLSPPLTTPLNFFVGIFWANVLLVVAMFCWDLWRHGRVHRTLLIGGVSLLGAEVVTAFLFFNPTWNALATNIVHAWAYTGGMP